MEETNPITQSPKTLDTISEDIKEVKRKRGRPRKDGSDPKPSESKSPEVKPIEKIEWTLDATKKLLAAEGLAWAGVTGWGGFVYQADDLEFLAPLGLEVFKELLPDSKYTIIAAFFLGYGGIKAAQFRAWKNFKMEEQIKNSVSKIPNPDEKKEDAKGS